MSSAAKRQKTSGRRSVTEIVSEAKRAVDAPFVRQGFSAYHWIFQRQEPWPSPRSLLLLHVSDLIRGNLGVIVSGYKDIDPDPRLPLPTCLEVLSPRLHRAAFRVIARVMIFFIQLACSYGLRGCNPEDTWRRVQFLAHKMFYEEAGFESYLVLCVHPTFGPRVMLTTTEHFDMTSAWGPGYAVYRRYCLGPCFVDGCPLIHMANSSFDHDNIFFYNGGIRIGSSPRIVVDHVEEFHLEQSVRVAFQMYLHQLLPACLGTDVFDLVEGYLGRFQDASVADLIHNEVLYYHYRNSAADLSEFRNKM